MTSVAHCKIAKPLDLFARLQRLLASFRPDTNRHEQAALMIEACIGEGIDTGPKIIEMLGRLGFDPRHVAITLKSDNPYIGRWQRSADCVYRLTA